MTPLLPAADISSIAHAIELAVAPVFLLTGIAGLLSVLINRLGRVVDRFRTLHGRQPDLLDEARLSATSEMAVLEKRTWLIHRAIALCTGGALLVCMVIATLFIGYLVSLPVALTIAILFILAMVSLVAGLLFFLREVQLSTGYIHVLPR